VAPVRALYILRTKNLKEFVTSCGGKHVTECNWGDEVKTIINEKDVNVVCIPAQHWSQRALNDRNKTLWSGWLIEGPTKKFYYTGDTGYCEEEFRTLGERYGPIDLAAIPIGCYAPRDIMHSQHINIQEAIAIHKSVKARQSIGIHWGTYAMGSSEPYDEPRSLLREEVEKAGLKANEFITMQHGETWPSNFTETKSSSSSK